MVPMVITLSPILDFWDLTAIRIFDIIRHSQLVILIPVQFTHHIYQLPVFAKPISDRTRRRNYVWYYLFQHLLGFLGNVLSIPKIPLNKSLRDVGFLHQKFGLLCSAY